MPQFRYTWKIDWLGRASFTDSFIRTDSSLLDAANSAVVEGFGRARAGILPGGCVVASCLISTIQGAYQTFFKALNLPGLRSNPLSNPLAEDVPMVSCLLRLSAREGARRGYLVRGLVDDDVKGAKFRPETPLGPWNNFIAYLGLPSTGFLLQSRQQNARIKVTSVTGAGYVTTDEDHGLTTGSVVYVSTRSSGSGPHVQTRGKVAAVLDAKHLNVKPWTRGDCVGGYITALTTSYPQVTRPTLPIGQRCRTRKVGRPLDLYSGRRKR